MFPDSLFQNSRTPAGGETEPGYNFNCYKIKGRWQNQTKAALTVTINKTDHPPEHLNINTR